MDIIVRRIRADDALVMRDIRLRALATDRLAFGSTYEREVLRPDEHWIEAAQRSATSGDAATFLALDGGGEAVGLAFTKRDQERADLFGVYSVWVAPAWRGRGIGIQLLAALEAWVIDRGGTLLQLQFSDAAPAARRLYQRAGFVIDGRVAPSPHPGITEHGMTKILRR
jgi:GNAT superfamily N-acetyltransferase